MREAKLVRVTLLLFLTAAAGLGQSPNEHWLALRHKEWDPDHQHWHYVLNKAQNAPSKVTPRASALWQPWHYVLWSRHDDPSTRARELWYAP